MIRAYSLPDSSDSVDPFRSTSSGNGIRSGSPVVVRRLRLVLFVCVACLAGCSSDQIKLADLDQLGISTEFSDPEIGALAADKSMQSLRLRDSGLQFGFIKSFPNLDAP